MVKIFIISVIDKDQLVTPLRAYATESEANADVNVYHAWRKGVADDIPPNFIFWEKEELQALRVAWFARCPFAARVTRHASDRNSITVSDLLCDQQIDADCEIASINAAAKAAENIIFHEMLALS